MINAFESAVADEYYASVSNKDRVQQPKRVVLFSGVVGSGKSTVARAIEQRLHAIRLSNDDVRDLITAADPAIDLAKREEIKLTVVTELLERVAHEPNGLVIIDNSCDRGFDYYKKWADTYGYRIILLRMDVPRPIVERQIRERGTYGYRDVDASLAMLDTWWQQWQDFGKNHTPDVVITPFTPLEKVFATIGFTA